VKSAATITRRSLLGLAALGLAGCKHRSSASTPRVDPDASALATARAVEIELLLATTDPGEHARHLGHLAALGGTAPTAVATPATTLPRPLLRTSAKSLREAAVAAVDGTHAALFASIAASHEVMLGD
jgi:hypothetical protein